MNACACVPLCSIVVGQFSDLEEEQNQTAREERMLEYTKHFKQLQMSVAKRRIQAFFDKRKARVEAASQARSGAASPRTSGSRRSGSSGRRSDTGAGRPRDDSLADL